MGIENILYTKFLNAIYQETKAMIQTYDNLIPGIKNAELQAEAAISQRNFNAIANECELLAKAENRNIKDNSWLEKATKWTTEKLAVMANNSNESFASLIMESAAMGSLECDKIQAEFVKVDKSLDELTSKLQKIFESAKEAMKEYI